MKINQKLSHITVDDNFIEDYLRLNGIEDIYKYMNPTWDCVEPGVHLCPQSHNLKTFPAPCKIQSNNS